MDSVSFSAALVDADFLFPKTFKLVGVVIVAACCCRTRLLVDGGAKAVVVVVAKAHNNNKTQIKEERIKDFMINYLLLLLVG